MIVIVAYIFSFRERKSPAVSFLKFRVYDEVPTGAAFWKLHCRSRGSRVAPVTRMRSAWRQETGWYRGIYSSLETFVSMGLFLFL